MAAPDHDATMREAAAAGGYLPAWHTAHLIQMLSDFRAIGVRMSAGVSGDPEIVLGPAHLPDGRCIPCSMSLHDDGWSYYFDFGDFPNTGTPSLSCEITWIIPDELKEALCAILGGGNG